MERTYEKIAKIENKNLTCKSLVKFPGNKVKRQVFIRNSSLNGKVGYYSL